MLEICEHAPTSLRRKEMTTGFKDTVPGLEPTDENTNWQGKIFNQIKELILL